MQFIAACEGRRLFWAAGRERAAGLKAEGEAEEIWMSIGTGDLQSPGVVMRINACHPNSVHERYTTSEPSTTS